MGASQDAVPNPERQHVDVPVEDIESLTSGDATADEIALDQDIAFADLVDFGLSDIDDPDDDEMASESLQRRAADIEVLELLRACDVEGPVWDRYAESLIDYAVSMVDAWVATRKIYQMLWRLHIPVRIYEHERRRVATDPDYRKELVEQAVADAIVKLRAEILGETGWTPTGGSSLSSYFTGKCVIAFADALRKSLVWDRRQQEPRSDGTDTTFFDSFEAQLFDPGSAELRQPSLFDAPEQVACDHDIIRGHLLRLDPDDRELVGLQLHIERDRRAHRQDHQSHRAPLVSPQTQAQLDQQARPLLSEEPVMNVNRPDTDSDDANAEMIARMDALIERSSLGTDGARALRSRASKERTDRIKRLANSCRAPAVLAADNDMSRLFGIYKTQVSQRAASASGIDIGWMPKPVVYRADLNSLSHEQVHLFPADALDSRHDLQPFHAGPRLNQDDVYDLLRRYATTEGPHTWEVVTLQGGLLFSRRADARLEYLLTGYWTRPDKRRSKVNDRDITAILPWKGVDRYTCNDVFESSTRILSMRLPFGRLRDKVEFPSAFDASVVAECVQLWFLTDRLTRPSFGSFCRDPLFPRWEEDRYRSGEDLTSATLFRSFEAPVGPGISPDCTGDRASSAKIVHRVSVIMDARDIERSKLILESTFSAYRLHLDVDGGCTLDFGLNFADESREIGTGIPRPSLNNLLRLIVDRWRSPDPVESVVTDGGTLDPLEAVLITSTSNYEGFLSSAFDAIDNVNHVSDETGNDSEQQDRGELRSAAKAFAAELDSSTEEPGETATVVVVDGLDEEAPLIRVDGYLTAHGRVV